MGLIEKAKSIHFLCRGNHWKVINGQVILDTPWGRDEAKAKEIVDVLDKQVRYQARAEICAVPLLDDRKRLVKMGLDNALLATQNLLANTITAKFELKNKDNPKSL